MCGNLCAPNIETMIAMGYNIENKISASKSKFHTPNSTYMYLHSTYIFNVRRCGVRNSKYILPCMHLPFDTLSLNILSSIFLYHNIVGVDVQWYNHIDLVTYLFTSLLVSESGHAIFDAMSCILLGGQYSKSWSLPILQH